MRVCVRVCGFDGCYNSASIFTLRLLVHSASLRSFASRALLVNSDGWRATLFFSCEIYYALVMRRVIKCNLK
jgi:hypothetical protein